MISDSRNALDSDLSDAGGFARHTGQGAAKAAIPPMPTVP